jgi:hypothetical protein
MSTTPTKIDVDNLLKEIKLLLDHIKSRPADQIVLAITGLMMCVEGLHYVVNEMNENAKLR